MSHSYNGTSSVLSAASQTLGPALTMAMWIFPTSEGQSGSGAVFAFGPAFNEILIVRWSGGAIRAFRILSGWTGGFITWDMTTGFPALNKWLWIAITMNLTPGSDPILCTLVDNTFSVLTEGSGLSGGGTTSGAIYSPEPQGLYIGNNANTSWTFAGLMGERVLWKRILSAAELEAVARLGVNVCPDHFHYLPGDGGSLQNLGSSGTAFTGTNLSAGENPPIRPGGRRG